MPTTEIKADEKAYDTKDGLLPDTDMVTVTGAADVSDDDDSLTPTEEQMMTLRKVAAPMPYVQYTRSTSAVEFRS
jgi:hypothetical protein